jgi:hypothetical protein
VKRGDLVVPWQSCSIQENKEPTFFQRGRRRTWEPDQPAVIVDEFVRMVGDKRVPKFQILLDGELWWTGFGQARLAEVPDETR